MRSNGELTGRIKKANLLSGVGALTLGVGLGAMFSHYLGPFAIPVLLVGILAHAVGMIIAHRLENAATETRLWWVEGLYWACWALLLGMIVYVAFGYLRG